VCVLLDNCIYRKTANVDSVMCYWQQRTVVGQSLCLKVVVRVPADDSAVVFLMIVFMFLVAQGDIFLPFVDS